jgi:YidC/Oxa1 family membrane protein insertase
MIAWFSNTLGGGYYLIGLLFYALIFKIVFLPFSIKQQKNQIAMAKLTPKIELIKAKYRGRNDQPTMQKMQQEIMELQQAEGYNPLSGCLPLLIQMPIIIFLYNVIRNPLSYICKVSEDGVRAICKILLESGETIKGVTIDTIDSIAIKNIDQIGLVSIINRFGVENISIEGVNLENLPDFSFFGIGNLAGTPWEGGFAGINWLWLIPIIAAALTWLSMFLTRRWNGSNNVAQDQQSQQNQQAQATMKSMDIMMPAMTLFMAFGFSGMMGIYWIYQSALGILQTFILSKAMPLPKYTEEELKAMKKAQKAAEKAQRQALKNQPKYRSLHYIDEDDYDELPEIKATVEQKKKAEERLPDIND